MITYERCLYCETCKQEEYCKVTEMFNHYIVQFFVCGNSMTIPYKCPDCVIPLNATEEALECPKCGFMKLYEVTI